MVGVLTAIRDDLRAFGERLRPTPRARIGLHTYRMDRAGDRRRIHLRIDRDGSGLLFIDGSHVIHLNAQAAELAFWALDGISRHRAEVRLRARYGRSKRRRWLADLEAIYALVARCQQWDGVCPTCGLGGIEHMAPRYHSVTAPYRADLAVTYDCNNDCPHCYNKRDRIHGPTLPVAVWERMIDQLYRIGVPHLIFTGGEPTLYPGLFELIRHADGRGAICGLNTNGRRLQDRSYVAQLEEAGLNHVQITVGSHQAAIHNRMVHAPAFQETVQGLRNCIRSGLHTITNTTLMRMNADTIEDTISFLHALGIRTFAVNGMIRSGGGSASDQALPESELAGRLVCIRDQARSLGMKFLWYTPTEYCRLSPVELGLGAKRCSAAEYSICVEPNGDVLPCQSYYATAGNLLHDPWDTLWNGPLFRKIRDRDQDPRANGLPEKCWDCPDRTICGGGCLLVPEAGPDRRTPDRRRSTGQFESREMAALGYGLIPR